MGIYKYIKEAHRKRSKEFILFERQRLIGWRKENVILKIAKPTNIARARELGYKAKMGVSVARIKIKRGGKKTPKVMGGRSSKHSSRKFVMGKNFQTIAEERVAKKFINLEVLNSYKIAQDGKSYWFEVILIDPCRPEIINDKDLKWICSERGRVHRGKTSAARKGRGLRKKGEGTEKIRPSLRAHKNLGK